MDCSPYCRNVFDIKKGVVLESHPFGKLLFLRRRPLRTRASQNLAGRAAECPRVSAAVGMLSGHLERVGSDSRNNRDASRCIETRRRTGSHSSTEVSRFLCEISFLGHGRVSQIGLNLGLVTALSIGCELRDCDRRQDADNGNDY